MEYRKLAADCNEELMKKVIKASDVEKRTLANFIRIACEERAEKILKKNGNLTTN